MVARKMKHRIKLVLTIALIASTALANNGFNVNATNQIGETQLLIAARARNLNRFLELLALGANTEQVICVEQTIINGDGVAVDVHLELGTIRQYLVEHVETEPTLSPFLAAVTPPPPAVMAGPGYLFALLFGWLAGGGSSIKLGH